MYGYYCAICKKGHQMNSKVGREHYSQYLLEQDKLDKLANIKRLQEVKPTKEEMNKRLHKSIFGDIV